MRISTYIAQETSNCDNSHRCYRCGPRRLFCLPFYPEEHKSSSAYINLAGIEGHFFVTLKNGTKLGDTSLSSPVTVYIELTVHDLTRNMLMVSKNL